MVQQAAVPSWPAAEPAAPARVAIGWREWAGLPALGIGAIRAKVDTGARSSALHVDWLQEDLRDGATWLRFGLRPHRGSREVVAEAPACDRRRVTDSGGQSTQRWFIATRMRLAGCEFDLEINLTSRRGMLFPLLLGRTALQQRFVVDPAASFLGGRRARTLR